MENGELKEGTHWRCWASHCTQMCATLSFTWLRGLASRRSPDLVSAFLRQHSSTRCQPFHTWKTLHGRHLAQAEGHLGVQPNMWCICTAPKQGLQICTTLKWALILALKTICTCNLTSSTPTGSWWR